MINRFNDLQMGDQIEYSDSSLKEKALNGGALDKSFPLEFQTELK